MDIRVITRQLKNISQRDLIACLILLIFIIMAVLLLVSGGSRQAPIEMPVDEFRSALIKEAELQKDSLKSEYEGIKYQKKLDRKVAIAKRKAEEKKRAERQLAQSQFRNKRYIAKKIKRAKSLEYIPSSGSNIEKSDEYKAIQGKFKWNGPVINRSNGSVHGPSGKETYYNLPMGGVVSIMRGMGNRDQYWIRSDGCKMLGYYIMVAANLKRHPRGSIVKCSRGYAIVCDTGTFAYSNPNQLDIAVNW